ncbi:hypothetical protein [Aeromicrobium fastidiosum]|uniref:Uncharacterized protein n=1 Tax=Aeromicrobium fastidiosum TaxID=52699 RepID=A0A641AR57_9ACTN|nr:hypothetical protein [Aeromicrobium fastidiosum]KAA1380435.1 hypothetical protein ESP62_004435 [Aeromicrobium fastidiosum]MBP2390013.1 hypothetical protein [Aeromicrobium fastidiosum]
MRSSLLTRSVVAVASLAVGSVALAAVPASAVTPSGVTRDQVLAAAASIRATGAGNDLTDATIETLRTIATPTCSVAAGDQIVNPRAYATAAGDDADGFLASVTIVTAGVPRYCDFGAVAVVDPTYALTGGSTITGRMTDTPTPEIPGSGTPLTFTAPLSGQVAVTAPINGGTTFSVGTTFTATGNAAKTTTTKTSTKVKDKKTTKQKKAAKKKYVKRLAQAKKNYAKALDKAGSSKNKKAAAKRVYAKARALAKAKYKSSISGFKVVTRTVTTTDNKPFSVTAGYSYY